MSIDVAIILILILAVIFLPVLAILFTLDMLDGGEAKSH